MTEITPDCAIAILNELTQELEKDRAALTDAYELKVMSFTDSHEIPDVTVALIGSTSRGNSRAAFRLAFNNCPMFDEPAPTALLCGGDITESYPFDLTKFDPELWVQVDELLEAGRELDAKLLEDNRLTAVYSTTSKIVKHKMRSVGDDLLQVVELIKKYSQSLDILVLDELCDNSQIRKLNEIWIAECDHTYGIFMEIEPVINRYQMIPKYIENNDYEFSRFNITINVRQLLVEISQLGVGSILY